MQNTRSQYAGQNVVVSAGYSGWPDRKLFLSINLNIDESVLDYQTHGKNFYWSYNYPELDWESIRTVRDELNRLDVIVPDRFFIDLAIEYGKATRHLIGYYHCEDDDSDMPF